MDKPRVFSVITLNIENIAFQYHALLTEMKTTPFLNSIKKLGTFPCVTDKV